LASALFVAVLLLAGSAAGVGVATRAAEANGQIVFVRGWSDGNREIYVMNADGSGQRRLTRNPADDASPAWSPDGSRIAFDSSRNGIPVCDVLRCSSGNSEIYVMNSDGSGQRRLTRNPADDEAPAWSPDGRKIAFMSYRDGSYEIYVMNADGSGQRRLTRGSDADEDPAWSPDGRLITFVRSLPDANDEIYVMNADGSGQHRLTRGLAQDKSPAWSPDGRRIAFDRDNALYVMNADGGGLRRLTRSGGSDPTWSPDGRRIAFDSSRDDRHGVDDIYILNLDGSGVRRLTRNAAPDNEPAWSPMPVRKG
jgi:Tol biopolymer transport system component